MEIAVDSQTVYINTGGMDWSDDQPWLCLVHGASLDHTVWVLYSRYFARNGYNVITPDLPGHGRSAGQVPDSIEAMGEWLAALIKKIGVNGKLVLAGHSMGSLVTLHAASLEKLAVERLILLGTATPMPVGDALLDAAKDNDLASIDMVSIFGHALQSRLGGNPVAGINMLQSGIKLMQQARSGVMYHGLSACNRYLNGHEDAARVSADTTLILGELDMMTHPAGAAKLGRIMSANTVLLERCGHMMLAEQPEQTLQAILGALN